MRILLLSHAAKDPDGGSSRVYHLLQDGLTKRGHTVKVLHFEDIGIPAIFRSFVTRFFFPQAISHRAEREDLTSYDVVMSSSGMLYPLFQRLKGHLTRPLLVAHLHGSSFLDRQAELNEMHRGHASLSLINRIITGPLRERWDRLGSESADLTIAQNTRDMDLMLEVGAKHIAIVPLPVHPEILAGCDGTTPIECRDPYSLLWFGSWSRRKGSFYLPAAFKMIAKRYPQATLTLWGTGLDVATIRREFDETLWNRLAIHPRITRAEQIARYGDHSILLFPSISEGFGLALLEAMAMGLAAVTTNSGMGGDWLVDQKNAMIVPVASAVHLAQAVMKLIDDHKLHAEISSRGAELAKQFTLDRYINQCELLFRQSLDRIRSENR